MDMYTEGAQSAGQLQLLHHINTSGPCPCQHCVHYGEPGYGDHGRPGYQTASVRKTDQPSLDFRRDIQTPWTNDGGRRAFIVDRVERSSNRSPQRRPMFAGPDIYSQSDDIDQLCLWELNRAQSSYPLEPGVRHFPTVTEQCGCVVNSITRAHPINNGAPHSLPHLQAKGQGYRLKSTVRYVAMDAEEKDCGCIPENYHLDMYNPYERHLHMPNGHCGPVFFELGEERHRHQDQHIMKGETEEGCNGHVGFHKVFLPTESPHKHFNQSIQKRSYLPPSSITHSEPSKSTTNCDNHRKGLKVVRQKRRQDLVRDQIRQVVTELEDVLGGLKQVHMEMKEVVEQISRLTAGIDLSEDVPCVIQTSSSNLLGSVNPGNIRWAALPNTKPAIVQASQQTNEDCIILRTNSLSSVHMASVVKTSCFTPTNHSNEITYEMPSVNGHFTHKYPPRHPNNIGQSHPEPQSQSLEPEVVIGNSTSNSRTQKPPLYRQNGQCRTGSRLPPKPVRTPAISARARQMTSMV
ncbi:uncharacterized protein [Antennarius striatus]|uniref:uncharacterized protein n=1 Tax=Antennarius striatus TaxID=241820 RepID=UPI0035B437BB